MSGTVGPLIQSIISNISNSSVAIRPDDLMNVQVQLAIVKTLELSNSGIFSISAALILSWVDPRLTFDCGIASFVNLPATYFWCPSIGLINCPDEKCSVSPDASAVAFVLCSGTVTTVLQRPYTATCKVDLTTFPFDSQSCTISFIAYDVGPSASGINFTLFDPTNNTVDTSLYQPAGEFNLTGGYVVAPGPFSCILGVCFSSFQIVLNYKRNATYYILTIILPAILLTLLISVAIVIPSENSVKISVTASLMVSLYVLQQNVTRLLPAGATTSLCAIGSFASLFLGCVALVCTTVSVIVRMQKPSLGPRLERWLQKFEWLLCVCTGSTDRNRVHSKNDDQDDHESSIGHSQTQLQKQAKVQTNATEEEEEAPLIRIEKQLGRMLTHMEQQASAGKKAEETQRTQAAREKSWRLFDSVSNWLIFVSYLVGALACILLYQWQI